jgi:DNA mismatch repair protein MutS2
LIAKRLNLPEEILENAKSMVDPTELKSDDLLNEIHFQREVARKARSAADRDRSLATNLRQELSLRLEQIEEERRAVLENARQEAEGEVSELKKELDALRKKLAHSRQPLDEVEEIQHQVKDIEKKVARPVEKKTVKQPGERPLIQVGRKVKVRSLKMSGVITAVSGDDVEVQVGNLRVRVKAGELTTVMEESVPSSEKNLSPNPQSTASISSDTPFKPTPGMELDLRGQRAEDALDILDRYLDEAFMSGMPFVRIIHGKGTGRLRQVIREALKESMHVKSFEEGGEKEGGEGVTVAHMNTD